MATSRDFSAMLNEFLPNPLLNDTFIRRDWLMSNIEHRKDWLGGTLVVPFEGAHASSVSFGALTSTSNVASDTFVRGQVTQPEAWFTMKFLARDLMEHGKISEQNFVRLLPDRLERGMAYFKEVCSTQMLGKAAVATATADGTAAGVLEVDHVERFTIGQYVTLDDDNSSQANYFVIAVNLNGGTLLDGSITLSSTSGGGAADISAYTLAQNTKVYHPGLLSGGTVTGNFSSVRNCLLSSANGGDASYLGQTKTTYPWLQAINYPGASVTSANILEKLFDFYTSVRTKARGNANKLLMSFKHLGSCMKAIETQKGGFKVTAGQTKATEFGWTEIVINTVRGELTLVGCLEMDDDVIYALDLSSWTLYSNGGVKKNVSPDGLEYYQERATTGYSYYIDLCFFGDLVCKGVNRNGVMFGISY